MLFNTYRSLIFGSALLTGNAALAAEAQSLADIANNILFGAEIVTDFLHIACLVIGIGFIIYALISYRTHRQNPKLMPLDRPILYLILGLILSAVPFLDYLLGDTGRAVIQKSQSGGDSYYEESYY